MGVQTLDLFCAPAEECLAGVSCGMRDWLGGGPRAINSHRGWCHKGEPWGSGLLCCQKRLEMGISEEEPPSALPEGPGLYLEPVFSEQTVENKKMLSSIKSTSNHLQITLGLLALPAFEVANPLCHS
ncbi:protein FAM220A [Vulpes vulpes]|uniref:Protein FAM220A n=1 Tax=Vulpes vulpes TaxID=9627 RepID=A0ABM5A8W6_VULVU